MSLVVVCPRDGSGPGYEDTRKHAAIRARSDASSDGSIVRGRSARGRGSGAERGPPFWSARSRMADDGTKRNAPVGEPRRTCCDLLVRCVAVPVDEPGGSAASRAARSVPWSGLQDWTEFRAVASPTLAAASNPPSTLFISTTRADTGCSAVRADGVDLAVEFLDENSSLRPTGGGLQRIRELLEGTAVASSTSALSARTVACESLAASTLSASSRVMRSSSLAWRRWVMPSVQAWTSAQRRCRSSRCPRRSALSAAPSVPRICRKSARAAERAVSTMFHSARASVSASAAVRTPGWDRTLARGCRRPDERGASTAIAR